MIPKQKLVFCFLSEHTLEMGWTVIFKVDVFKYAKEKDVTMYPIILTWGLLKIHFLLKDKVSS